MGFLDKVKKTAETATKKKTDAELTAEKAKEHNRKIEDVLEVLQIQSTFEIPGEIFLPDELKEVEFDIQVPHGFDQGQVMRFVSQTRESVKFFVALLKQRNQDVAKLASVIDKLQVDANNLRFDHEIAQGISIMPTQDDNDLENNLMDARLQIRALEDKIKALTQGGQTTTTGVEKEAYEAILDELTVMKRKNAALEEEVFTLKTKIAIQEDEADDELGETAIREAPLSDEEYEALGISLPTPGEQEDFALPKPHDEEEESSSLGFSGLRNGVLPNLHEQTLPEIEEQPESIPLPTISESTELKEEPEITHSTVPNFMDDDDDENLEELMRQLRGS